MTVSKLIINSCFVVPDPCLMDPCDVSAECVWEGLSPNFTCKCTEPFTGDGFNCSSKFSIVALTLHYCLSKLSLI